MMYEKNEISNNKNIFCSTSKPDMLFNMPNIHYHNHHEIYYLLSGKRKYFIDNQIYNVNKGDIVLIPKGVLHKTTIADNSYHQRLLISFNDNMICPDFQEIIMQCFDRYVYHVSPALSNQLEMILFKIEREYKRGKCL
ncbi:MAG: cupin domain-containing protein [Erysipelotrichia bacterium]|nr:cupin domain-containing protein [Erysipelotrichia bacterium]